MNIGQRMVPAMERAQVKVASGVPDNWLTPIIESLTAAESLVYAPAAREEDALGICLGAALAGVRAVCLMQNAGALNTGGTLATLGISYGVTVVMLVTDREHLGDVTVAHFEKGRAFRPFLDALRIPYYELTPDFDQRDQLTQAFQMAELGQRPVALLMTRSALEGRNA